ncbi:hypothetical protein [Streptomyces gobiensis]|uniref:hypothetical protein n=1 Tax=Streptomyces gobiensis TaxID=2875706 RepID=UPI001E55934C|nr:hypothetical protein [Streptomyces gobiensis]UGY92917.1 hypothetical protein test1122_15190 [Streptomyces gobiensis]
MRRRAYMGGAAAVAALAVGLAACTGGSNGAGDTSDPKPGDTPGSTGAAKPGKHRSLPEPCGSVAEDTLRELLTDAADASAPTTLEGDASVTYDIDRRVGCRWKNTTSLGSRHLTIDFERVVSYEAAVSDDDRAAELYDTKALKDEIPATPPTADDSPSGDISPQTDGSGDPEDAKNAEDAESADSSGSAESPETSEDSTSASPSSSPALAPRPLEGIGDAAYLNDELTTADSGVHRDITLVFRTGNVIVTVEYDQWSTGKSRLPDSEELQEKAQKLAKELAGRLDS